MRVLVRIASTLRDQDDCILVRPLFLHPKQAKVERAGTVLLTNVSVAANIRGDVVETSERRVKPRQTVLSWPKMRYVSSIGSYVDVRDGHRVERAKAVYIVGPSIYYLPEAS